MAARRRGAERRPPLPFEQDVVLLLQACTAALDDRVLRAVRARGADVARYGDGFVFQHLAERAMTVTELARLLYVTQQAASKQVADLERRGLVTRTVPPTDRRSRLIALTDLGWRAIEAARSSRREINVELTDALGERWMDQLRQALVAVSDMTGAVETMRGRRLRPEAAR